MRRDNLSAVVIGLCAILAIAAALLPALAPLRPFVTPPLVLLWPGLAIIGLVLPSRVGRVESLVLACGLSLAITVLAGLLLNVVHSMTLLGWVSALGGTTLAACALRLLANLRRPLSDAIAMRTPRLTLAQGSLLATATLIALSGIALARLGALNQREYAFTEFWMTPRGPVDQNLVTVGIHNEEKARVGYQVAVVADGSIIGRWPSVIVEPGATWTTEISLDQERRHSQRVEAWLYRSDAPDVVYRKVWLASSAS